MIDEEKEEKLKDFMNRISFVLKDTTLQQGFELICKKLAEYEKENAELKEDVEGLANINIKAQDIIAELKKQIDKMKKLLKL